MAKRGRPVGFKCSQATKNKNRDRMYLYWLFRKRPEFIAEFCRSL